MPPVDPNQSSGRASTAISNFTFPLDETPTMKTRMTFMRYSRLTPASEMTLQPSAIITLPLPLSIPDNLSLKIGQDDLGAYGNLDIGKLRQAHSQYGVAGMANEALNQGVSVFRDAVNQYAGNDGFMKAIHDLAVAPGIADSRSDLTRFAQRTVGVVVNPHTNSFFEGVNLRSYQLSWRLAPKSAAEAQAIHNIKTLIKARALPTMSINKYALDYPDLVDVEFVGDSSKYLNKYYRSFINDFTASPGNGNGLSFFEDGSPTEIELTLRLTELNIITRESITGEE